MTIQLVVGVNGLYPVNDNISKMWAKRGKIQTLLIWWHQLYLGGLFSHVYSPNSSDMLFVKPLNNLKNNYVQIIAYPEEQDLLLKLHRNNRL